MQHVNIGSHWLWKSRAIGTRITPALYKQVRELLKKLNDDVEQPLIRETQIYRYGVILFLQQHGVDCQFTDDYREMQTVLNGRKNGVTQTVRTRI